MTMMNESYEELVESLPDDETEIEKAQATLVFIGEAWINDRAREVDDGHYEYTVPLADLHLDTTEFIKSPGKHAEGWFIHSTVTSYHVADAFKNHEEAPEDVQNWQGPFTIKLKTWGI